MRTLSNGLKIILNSVSIFFRWPKLIFPLFLTWIFYALSVLYLKYFYLWGHYSFLQNFLVSFSFIILLSIFICFSSSWLLEMLQDIEKHRDVFFVDTFKRVFIENFINILPIAIIWAFLWFTLSVINFFLRKKDKNSDEYLTAQSAAETLAGVEDFSLSNLFIEALQKGIRMIVFLIMPAIAWENLGTFTAIKKGILVFRMRLRQFTVGYALTYAASGIIFIPVVVMFKLGTKGKHGSPPLVDFSEYAWIGLIVYVGLAWSFVLYLEQMFTASLYLWHLNWEKLCSEAKDKNETPPDFYSVHPPHLFSTLPELREFYGIRQPD